MDIEALEKAWEEMAPYVDMWRSIGLRCYAVAAGDF